MGPPFWDLIATNNASFLSHFSRPDSGAEMAPNNAILSRDYGPERGPVNSQWLVRDLRWILGESPTNPLPTQEAPFLVPNRE